MTRLGHTADVHLRPDAEERLEALEAVLTTAADHDVDVLTIGGDLFDRPADVEELRSDLRNRYFSDLDFEVVLIPGNHDVEAFRQDLLFGDACTVIADEADYGEWTSADGDLKIVAIPYRTEVTDDLLFALDTRPAFDGTEILLFHGSLDAPIGADPGDEAAYRYFPVTEELLAELGFDYYLAGHYHGAHLLQFDGGAEFAYPGTPASTRTSETDRRGVVLLDPDDGLSVTELDTFHHLEKHVTVTPGEEAAAIAEIDDWVDTAVAPSAAPSIVVDGVIDRGETDFADRLSEVAEPDWITNHTVSAAHVRAHPVCEAFEARLDETEWDDDMKAAVWTRTLRAASRSGLSRGVE